MSCRCERLRKHRQGRHSSVIHLITIAGLPVFTCVNHRPNLAELTLITLGANARVRLECRALNNCLSTLMAWLRSNQ